jgi:hypothetical protein
MKVEGRNSVFELLKTDKEIKDKPFFCSLCMTHHIGVLYLLIAGHFTLFNWLFVCLFAFLTPIIKEIFYLLNALMLTIIDYLYFIMRK